MFVQAFAATLRAELKEKFVTTSTVPVREIGLIGLTATALYALLAMISYSPADPSFTFSGSGGEVHNLVRAGLKTKLAVDEGVKPRPTFMSDSETL